MDKSTIVQSLRDLAAYIEARDWSCHGTSDFSMGTVYLFCEGNEDFAKNARLLGSFTKESGSGYLNLFRNFGPIRFEVTIPHAKICKRVVVGTRVIPAEPERVIPAKPEHIEELYEWHCPDSVLKIQEPVEPEPRLIKESESEPSPLP